MTCDGNVCKPTKVADPGTVNGACLQDNKCSQPDGGTLQCASGTCQVATCPSGNPGCPCGSYGSCNAVAGQTVICNRGLCVAASCTQGDVGCACPDGGTCKFGLQCTVGICQAAGPAIHVAAAGAGAGARACDVVVALPELAGAKATFDTSVIGETFQRGKTFALSYAAREDKDLTEQAAVIERVPTWWGEGVTTWSQPLTIQSAVCYDRLGNSISEAKVNVQ